MRSKFTKDDRGVSEVIGAILVFGLLIALMAVLQTQAVPAANQEVEFNHNQEVHGDLAKFHERASRVTLSGEGESITVQAGTGYPSRMLFFNPPRVAGTISTSDRGTASIQNAEAIDPEVDDYLDGSAVQVDSRTLEYRVDYNEYQNAPTTRYEYGILYDEHRDATVVKNTGSVIDDTNINLVFMAGNYSRTSGTAQSLDVQPVSAPARPVTVTGQNNNPIVLELPTNLSVSKWKELYEDQDTVNDISDAGNGKVRIELDGSKRYTMRMAGLGLEQGVDKPEAQYIVPADDGVSNIGSGGQTSVAFEVRDQYNNPVAGQDVEITFNGNTRTVSTTEDGRAVISVSASSTGTATGEIAGCSGSDRCTADYDVNVRNPGGLINPSSGVRLQSATLDSSASLGNVVGGIVGEGSSGDAVEMKFDVSGNLEFESVRVNFYGKSGNEAPPETWAMDDGNNGLNGEVSGDYKSTNTLDPSNSILVAFGDGSGNRYDISTDDYFVVSVILSNGEQAIYFVSPENP